MSFSCCGVQRPSLCFAHFGSMPALLSRKNRDRWNRSVQRKLQIRNVAIQKSVISLFFGLLAPRVSTIEQCDGKNGQSCPPDEPTVLCHVSIMRRLSNLLSLSQDLSELSKAIASCNSSVFIGRPEQSIHQKALSAVPCLAKGLLLIFSRKSLVCLDKADGQILKSLSDHCVGKCFGKVVQLKEKSREPVKSAFTI